ncbi:MAG TPA: methionyl-tRNA formyltransferase [Puia sp.]|nr:methionyl-tRNA formyltransferase [Puia sp.]
MLPTHQPPRIVFMGTPEFAVASLKAILENGFFVVAVVTAPDRPAGRGMKLMESPVKQFAIEKQIPVLQPLKLKDPGFISTLAGFAADIQVVVAFRMLPEAVWSMPPLGTINLHASLLPQYRGAAPINRAIMQGETETGLTTFKMKQEIDTGNILLSERMSIGPDETAGELHDRMKVEGGALLVETLKRLFNGSLKERPQSPPANEEIKTAPKLFTADAEIDWSLPVLTVQNQIRGLSPYPGAFTRFNGKQIKVLRSHVELSGRLPQFGDYETDGKSWLRFSAKGGFIYIDEIQPEGKRKMQIGEFLRGQRLAPGNLSGFDQT